MTRFLRKLILYPVGPQIETPQEKLARIVAKTRDSYECRRFRERRQAALRHTPKLILVKSQIVGRG